MGILNSYANNFWTQDERCETQRLYIQFSLFASAISDFAIGMELQNNSRLNWSASAFYYSMVHSGRFLIFSSLGDFPTSHSQLIYVIKGNNKVKGDWLKKFINTYDGDSNSENIFNDGFHLNLMIDFYIRIGFSDFPEQLKQFGEVIDKSKKLREDSNYESLLIAHEFDHSFVSPQFISLTQHIKKGCKDSLTLINKSFECFINNYPFKNISSENVKGFIDYYIHKRILRQLKERGFSNEIFNNIEDILCKKNKKTLIDIRQLQQMEENISFDFFDMKSGLMNNFRNKIRDLDIATRITEIEREREYEIAKRIEKLSISLLKAVSNKDINAIIELRNRGANINHKNEDGLTCLEFAKSLGVETVIDALTK